MSLIPTSRRSDSIDYDTLHFLLQTPSVQFIYWQLSTSKQRLLREHFEKDWRSLTPTLRFHEMNDHPSAKQAPERVLEMLLPSGESCFLTGLNTGQRYRASLGIRNEQGQFIPLLRSNTIQIPAQALSDLPQHQPSESDPHFVYQPTPIGLPQVTPDAHEHFSAYSVYVPKNTYSVDMESGGDTD
ncbi:hypothetical protein A8709_04215 [Paenibacillus pectinilyticus]|uniref:DUF4912 domain-containing protein n=1 Tax=Paenibacillus pectinilyticus TaxID=512399 RepID=A0A1C0ZS77_9BACL|nr:DUF4912 domain-containing protein [Paenibacillus pectinilyticus]OCT10917.1 hypothetical protein A8709_04215 [Paenibacillus pectinilyticus]